MQLSQKVQDYLYAAGAGLATLLLIGMFVYAWQRDSRNADPAGLADIWIEEPALTTGDESSLNLYRQIADSETFIDLFKTTSQSKIPPASLPDDLFFIFQPRAIKEYYAGAGFADGKNGFRIIYETTDAPAVILNEVENLFMTQKWESVLTIAEDNSKYVFMEIKNQVYRAVLEILALESGNTFVDVRIMQR